MLNIREGCVECVDDDTLKYDPMYQQVRPRRSTSAANALRKTREARCNSKCVLEGNRLVDVKNLSSFNTNKTACHPCATRAAVQLAFDFAGMLNADASMATRHLSGPSYSNRLKRHLRQRGRHAAAVNIPSCHCLDGDRKSV